ncbi:MAG TPA: O-antigen ligase family protein, partial [Candidatus Omnitrophota bacterium]|nr:O-antigen ligase family protein [Candidatus Omnitrophota bacterium]
MTWLQGFVAFAVPIMAVLANRGTMIPLALLALGGLAWAIRQRRFATAVPPAIAIAMAVVVGWAALTVAWAELPALVLPKAAALTGLLIAGLLAFALPVPAGTARRAAIVGVVAAAALVIFEIKARYPLTMLLADTVGDGAMAIEGYLPTRFKPSTTILALLAVALAGPAVARGRWLVPVLVVPPVAYAGILSGSMSALAALAAGAVGWGAVMLLPRVAPVLAGVAVAAGMVVAPAVIGLPGPYDLAMQYPSLPNSALHRVMIWRFASEKALERPALGWGLEASRELPGGKEGGELWMRATPDAPLVAQMQQRLPLHPHNFAVQIWLELGAVGILLSIGLLAAVLRGIVRTMPARYDRAAAVAGVTA